MRLRRRCDWTSPQNGRFVTGFGAGQHSMRVAPRMKREARRRVVVLLLGSSCHQLIFVAVHDIPFLTFLFRCLQVVVRSEQRLV